MLFLTLCFSNRFTARSNTRSGWHVWPRVQSPVEFAWTEAATSPARPSPSGPPSPTTAKLPSSTPEHHSQRYISKPAHVITINVGIMIIQSIKLNDIENWKNIIIVIFQTIQYITRSKVMETETRELSSISRGKIRPGDDAKKS